MLKKKNIYVIFISCLVILLVGISSFLGLVIYFQWHQLDMAYKYYDALEKSDTIAYASSISIDSVKAGLGLRNVALVEGRIKNKGKRTVISLVLNIRFLDGAGAPIYTCLISFLTRRSIEPNRTILFKSPLWKCPKRFVKMLRDGSFSNKKGEWSGRISAEVARVRLKPI